MLRTGSLLVTAAAALAACEANTSGSHEQTGAVSSAICTAQDCPDPPPNLCASYCTPSSSCDTPCQDALRRSHVCGDLGVGHCACSGALTASPTTITAPQATQLTWSASAGCGTAIALNGMPLVGRSGTVYSNPPPGTSTYTLSNSWAVLGSASVTVAPWPTQALTTLNQTLLKRPNNGVEHFYTPIVTRPGEPRTEMQLSQGPAATGPVHGLLALAHLTDIHIVDDQSPMRVPYLDHMADDPANHWPTNSAYFPHEVLTSQLADAMARAIRSVGAAPATGLPLSFTVLSGDGIDNTQHNETRQYINLLDGGVVTPNSHPNGWDEGLGTMTGNHPEASWYWHAESYTDIFGNYVGGEFADKGFPNMPGLYAAARRPFVATGLGMPWYACMGNHDVLVQGNMPIDYLDHWWNPYKTLRQIATESDRILGFPGGLPTNFDDISASNAFGDFFGDVFTLNLGDLAGDIARFVPDLWQGGATSNADRYPLTRYQFTQEHFNTVGSPVGHGFTQGSGLGYYAFNAGPQDLFKFIALDSNNSKDFGANGWIDNDQFTWLQNQLVASSSRYYDGNGNLVMQPGVKDQLMVLYSHHPLDSMNHMSDVAVCTLTGAPTSPGTAYQCPQGLWEMVPGGHPGVADGSGIPDVEHLLLRFPNVVLMLVGHIHSNRIRAHAAGWQSPSTYRGFWEVATAAVSDWPSQSRLVELGLRPDEPDGINSNGTLSIFTTMLDADAPVGGSPPASDGSPRNLAAIGRELAFNDFQQIIDLKTGGPDDRNKELQLAMPFSIAPLLDLSENWNEVSAPNLAAGWNSYAAGGNGWVTASDGASNMARVDDPSFVTDRWLESPVFVPAGDQVVGFTQTVNLEAYAAGGVGYDGTVLEISIGGAPYQDILAAGGRFDAGGYNLVISSGYQSPILGRRAWSGQSANRQYVQVRLPPAAGGRSTRLRWRVATDNSGLSSGYSVDDIHVSDLKCGETFGSPGSAIVCGAGETCSAGICTFDLTQNLLGHWPLNDASGSTTAADSSGHNLTGTVVGNVQFSANAGPNGTGAALFRGGNASGSPPGSYIDVSFPATAAGSGTGGYMPLGNVSYSMWFQTSNVNAPIQGIQEIWASTARGPMGYDRIIGNGGNGPLYYNSWSEVSFAGTKTVNDGQWHHVVYVFDQTNGFYAYVDGILDGYSVAPTANANGCAGIGCSNFNWATDYLIGTGGNGRFGALGFNGYISDVRIYNVPLAATGVQALYSANLPPPRGGGPGGGGACVPNRNPCQPGECAGSEPDGCGGFVDCHADCSVNGNVCPRAGGVCRANVCVCSTLNPS